MKVLEGTSLLVEIPVMRCLFFTLCLCEATDNPSKKEEIKMARTREPERGLPNLDKYLEGRRRHYVTYLDGARLYQLSYQTFIKLAKAAKANLKIRKAVIVDVDLIEQYLADNYEEAIYYDSLREV